MSVQAILVGQKSGGTDAYPLIASVETTSTATQAYSIGNYLIYNDKLYEVIDSISIGDTLTDSGANPNIVDATNVMDAVQNIKTLTYAEYQLLSADEKAADILYVITDDPSDEVYTKTETDILLNHKSDLSNLAPEEGLSTSTHDYVVGDYLTHFGKLYRVTAAIQVDDTLTPGTNITAVTVMESTENLKANSLLVSDTYKTDSMPEGYNLYVNGDVKFDGTIEADVESNSDNAPYAFRQTGGDVECENTEVITELTGGTVAWNQLVQNGNFADTSEWVPNFTSLSVSNNIGTVALSGTNGYFDYNFASQSNHKYLYMIDAKTDDATKTWNLYFFYNGTANNSWSGISSTSWNTYAKILNNETAGTNKIRLQRDGSVGDTVQLRNAKVFDLTQMFGSTIANYIYSLEQSTAGAGVAFFRNLFPKPYYDYNAGQLISMNPSAHKMVGFNIWDEQWEAGSYNNEGHKISGALIRTKNPIPVFPNTTYYFCIASGDPAFRLVTYDANMNCISSAGSTGNTTFTTPSNCKYIAFNLSTDYGTVYHNNVCINYSTPTGDPKNGDYVPYKPYVYPFGGIEIRGIPKLVNNALTFDGDSYKCDGQLTRKYGIVDLGKLNWVYFTTNSFYSDGLKTGGNAHTQNAICARYVKVSSLTDWPDKSFVGQPDGRIYIHDLSYSDAAALQSALSGVYLVYELASSTTESTDPFNSVQVCDPDGTEEFIDYYVNTGSRDVAMPVGHTTRYPLGYANKVAQSLMPITAYAPVVETAAKADKTDLTSIHVSGSTNNSGGAIAAGVFFYKDGTLVQAKTAIASGATLTLNTNYEVPTAGALNALKSANDTGVVTITPSSVAENITIHATYRTVYYGGHIAIAYISLTLGASIPAWTNLFCMTNEIIKPKYLEHVLNHDGRHLAVSTDGFIINADVLPAGTYVIYITYVI